MSKVQGLTTYEKGRQFESKVAKWARRYFKDGNPEIRQNKLARGYIVKRPYEVDVEVVIMFGGIFGFLKTNKVIWIECKWKQKGSVKRAEIQKLVGNAKDVYKAYENNMNDVGYDALMVISNAKLDIDALNYANAKDVWCIYYNGQRFLEETPDINLEDWLNNPAWLEQGA